MNDASATIEDWPAGSSEMAERIRLFDWVSTPLGPTEAWPSSLRAIVDLIVSVGFPMIALWGPELIQIYNDGYRALMGNKHPAGLGQPTRECWPEVWDINAPIYQRVRDGETLTFNDALYPITRSGKVEDAWFTLSYSPARNEDKDICGVLVAVMETTERVRERASRDAAEAALRESDERHAFLLKLSDALRPLTDTAEIEREATRLLGEYLEADRCFLSPVYEDGSGMCVREEYLRSGASSVLGDYTFAQFGDFVGPELHAGRILAVENVAELTGLTPTERGSYLATEIQAYLLIPLVRNAKLAAFLTINHRTPHAWSDADKAVARQTADRLWAARERSRVEAALRESDERQAFLLKLSDSLRLLRDPLQIQAKSMNYLAERLRVARAGYYEVAADQDSFSLTARSEHDTAPLPDKLKMSDFGPQVRDAYRAGRTLVSRDIERESSSAAGRAMYRMIGARARIGVPLVKEGRLLTVVAVHSDPARDWTSAEIQLVEDVAERTWEAVERARAEKELRDSQQRLQRVLETDAVAVLFFNRAGTLINANDVFLRMIGYTRQEVEARQLTWQVMTPEEYRLESAAQMEMLAETGRIGPYEKEYLRSDGSRAWMLFAGRDLGDGTIVEFGVNIDDRKRAERALRESEERFRQFGEASTDVLWMRDAESLRWTYLSEGFERIYGLERDKALAGDTMRNWVELIVPEDRAHALACIERVRMGERATFEYRIRRPADGQVRWMRNTDFPMRDAAGKVARIGGVGTDITVIKAAEAHQAILLAELQHRVRNTLAIVRSIARRTAENSATVEEMIGHFLGRLDAFSRVQAVLTRSPEAKVDLRSLIEEELVAHAAQDGRQVRIYGPDTALDPKTAERFSLAIHELASNAVKHGAFVNGGGHVAVHWKKAQADGSARLILNWEESGVEIRGQPTKEGFGMELLTRSLPFDLGAETQVEFRPRGLWFELSMPIDDGN